MANKNNFVISKTGKRYWLAKVYRPAITRRNGTVNVSPHYAVRLSHFGRRMTLTLATPNQAQAAELACEMYVYLRANGWPAFLAKYRSTQEADLPASTPVKKTDVTVGEFLAAVRAESDLSKKTFDPYASRFRYIVAEVSGIKSTKKNFDYRNGGSLKRAAKVDAVALAEVTPEKIRAWKKLFIDQAGTDEVARRRYTVSCNSYLRSAKSLFSKRHVLDKLRSVELPSVLPFEGVSVERRTDTKFYGCGVEPRQLLRAAVEELGTEHIEELKAFLLGLVLGLRRREADLLEWRSFNFDAGTLRIMPTKWYALKTDESASMLPVEPEILALFRGWHEKATGEFVIESERPPKAVSYQWYRCEAVFNSLLAWLRAKGVQGSKPFHQLRKLYGSALAEAHGIHVASSGLRHADLRTTSEFYADRRVKLTAGFGSVLSGAKVMKLPQTISPARPKLKKRAS
jgi:integrase